MDEEQASQPGPGMLSFHDGRYYAKRTYAEGFAEGVEGEVEVRPFLGPVAYVRVAYATLIPTEQFANVRIEVSLSMPCYPLEVDAVYKQVSEWCGKRLMAERDAVKAALEAKAK